MEVRKNACNVLRSRLEILTGIFSIWLATLFTGCSWNDSSHWWNQNPEKTHVETVLPNENISEEDLNMLQRRFANEIRNFFMEHNIQNFLSDNEISALAEKGVYRCTHFSWNMWNRVIDETTIRLQLQALKNNIADAYALLAEIEDDYQNTTLETVIWLENKITEMEVLQTILEQEIKEKYEGNTTSLLLRLFKSSEDGEQSLQVA